MSVLNGLALIVLTLTHADIASACPNEPMATHQRRGTSLAELRIELAESRERQTLIEARIKQQRRQTRPDYPEIDRLLCALRRELNLSLDLTLDLNNRLREEQGCFLYGYPPRCR